MTLYIFDAVELLLTSRRIHQCIILQTRKFCILYISFVLNPSSLHESKAQFLTLCRTGMVIMLIKTINTKIINPQGIVTYILHK